LSYEHSMRWAILAYKLLDPLERIRTGIPAIQQYCSNPEKIAKSGGYSRLIFPSWSSYADQGRLQLE
jgi:hypothetical protein